MDPLSKKENNTVGAITKRSFLRKQDHQQEHLHDLTLVNDQTHKNK